MSRQLKAFCFVAALICFETAFVGSAISADGPPMAGNPIVAPFKWAGQWSTKINAEGSLRCTAQFVSPRVIMLAAHCIVDRDSGEYYDPENKDSVFALQYQNRSFSKVYRPICKASYKGWVVPLKKGEKPFEDDWNKTMTPERREAYIAALSQSWQWDYAFVLLDAESITGHYKFRINEQWNGASSIGYPKDLMAGSVIQVVHGDVFSANVLHSMDGFPNVQVMWHNNEGFTQGSSGGAWVANASADETGADTNVMVGLNSFGNQSHQGASFSPQLNDKVVELLKFVEAGCKASVQTK